MSGENNVEIFDIFLRVSSSADVLVPETIESDKIMVKETHEPPINTDRRMEDLFRYFTSINASISFGTAPLSLGFEAQYIYDPDSKQTIIVVQALNAFEKLRSHFGRNVNENFQEEFVRLLEDLGYKETALHYTTKLGGYEEKVYVKKIGHERRYPAADELASLLSSIALFVEEKTGMKYFVGPHTGQDIVWAHNGIELRNVRRVGDEESPPSAPLHEYLKRLVRDTVKSYETTGYDLNMRQVTRKEAPRHGIHVIRPPEGGHTPTIYVPGGWRGEKHRDWSLPNDLWKDYMQS